MSASKFDHAIVIGGSIAGLTAARILTEHFAHVTVIERDRLQGNNDFRKGTPQARHAHVLLLRGLQLLEQIFPGLEKALLAGGAVPINPGQEQEACINGQWLPHFATDLRPLACSRILLEQVIFKFLASHPQISFHEETEVSELLTDAGKTRTTGVTYRSKSHNAPAETLLADLVVDASGRNSDTPRWLTEFGYTAPQEMVVNSFPGYATRVYERPVDFAESWKALVVFPVAPDRKRGGVVLPMEGNRWHVTLFGMAKDYPPTDEAGFMAFAQSLASPRVAEVLRQARPQSSIAGYRRAENRLYLYDQLPRYLEGLIVLGDAVYALNPVYGQGMTVAAMGSLKLGECLQTYRAKGSLNGLPQQFQKALRQIVAGPWQMATGEDMRWPGTEGGQAIDFPTRMVQKYMNQVMVAMGHNPKVTAQFFQVQQMVAEPTTLLSPRMMWEVFKTVRRVKREQKMSASEGTRPQTNTLLSGSGD